MFDSLNRPTGYSSTFTNDNRPFVVVIYQRDPFRNFDRELRELTRRCEELRRSIDAHQCEFAKHWPTPLTRRAFTPRGVPFTCEGVPFTCEGVPFTCEGVAFPETRVSFTRGAARGRRPLRSRPGMRRARRAAS